MNCPFCRAPDSRVIDSRASDDGSAIRRRRQCQSCARRFTTLENATQVVAKRSGVNEPFQRSKIIAGLRKACQGRPVTDDDLALLAQHVEEVVRGSGAAVVESHEIGLAILGPLRELDEVAYLRFASVYRNFASLADFHAEILQLQVHAASKGTISAPTPTSDLELSMGSAQLLPTDQLSPLRPAMASVAGTRTNVTERMPSQ